MKITFFSLLLLLTGFIQGNFGSDDNIVVSTPSPGHFHVTNECHRLLSPTEKNFREKLYWFDKYNPRYYMLDEFQNDLDYFGLLYSAFG